MPFAPNHKAKESVLRGRETPTKFDVLGAASGIELAAKRLQDQAKTIRAELSKVPADDLMTTTGSLGSNIRVEMLNIHAELTGLNDLFEKLVGAKRWTSTTP